MTGSLCAASSKTPARSLAAAAPEEASNSRARIEARYMTFPSLRSEREFRRPRGIHHRVNHCLEQALHGPCIFGGTSHEACFHHRCGSHHHEHPPARGEHALEARVVARERGRQARRRVAVADARGQRVPRRDPNLSQARTCCSIICSLAVCTLRPLCDLLQYPEKGGKGTGFPACCQAAMRRDMLKYRRGEGVPALCWPGPQARA